ncbi:MAG: hypothetical protein HY435_02190 [Candidatus Liptonbacteria bacterium]|nr:hypothetical protein [Candidatus Liptonbacteria bacterium]
MNQETKTHSLRSVSATCQNCKGQFVIDAQDFQFYEKISVPPPTFCPECRMMRKMVGSNERALFKRKCEAPGHNEELISRYPPGGGDVVYDQAYWWSDKWDPLRYGREYDFSQPFFEQFFELKGAVPRPNMNITNSVNCDYCTSAINSKNCYLVSGAYFSQDCMYSNTPALCRDAVDTSICIFCEVLYECFSCTRCFNLRFSAYCVECMDSSFLYDCHNVSNCFGCVGLRNKQYHIFNKPYSKKDYEAEMAKMDLGSYRTLQMVHARHAELIARFPRRYMISKNAVDCTGDNIEHAKNCKFSFEIRDGGENVKYALIGGRRLKDSYDVFSGGARAELLYEANAIGSERVFFSTGATDSFDVRYSMTAFGCAHLFGCAGLRNKEYCILNKQYTKEEYEKLVPKIMAHMNEMPYVSQRANGKWQIVYRYGEYFPPEFSTIAYNDSMAHEYFPLTKDAALEKKFRWRDVEEKNYEQALSPEELPDHIKDTEGDIFETVITCGHRAHCLHQCKGVFKIVPKELEFYRRLRVPLPRLCPECRHYERVEGKRRYRLWHRRCTCLGSHGARGKGEPAYKNSATHFHGEQPCPNEFETSYAPERPEIVYCEQCYQSEIV